MATEIRYLARSPKALLKGDAFTSCVDDEYILFYNPAAIGFKNGFSLVSLTPDFGFPNLLDAMERFEDFPSEPEEIADTIMGYPVHIHGGITPGFKMGPFAFTGFINVTSNLVLQNAIHPTMDIDYRDDRGFLLGYAHPLIGKMGDTSGTNNLYLGVAFKMLNRKSLVGSFDLFGTSLYNSVLGSSGDDPSDIIKGLGYSEGKAYGLDLGMLYKFKFLNFEFGAGMNVSDIGDTSFEKVSGTGGIPSQKMMVSSGVSLSQDFYVLDYTLSADIHPVLAAYEWQRKLHLGLEVGIPMIRIFTGYSAGYASYGVNFKFWPISLTAGIYNVEVGSVYRQQEGSRAIVYMNLFNINLDL